AALRPSGRDRVRRVRHRHAARCRLRPARHARRDGDPESRQRRPTPAGDPLVASAAGDAHRRHQAGPQQGMAERPAVEPDARTQAAGTDGLNRGAQVPASTLPDLVSTWTIQNASMSSWLIIATTPVPGAKK